MTALTVATIVLAVALAFAVLAWGAVAVLIIQDVRIIRREVVDAGNARRLKEKRSGAVVKLKSDEQWSPEQKQQFMQALRNDMRPGGSS